jgi:hypothetical protein
MRWHNWVTNKPIQLYFDTIVIKQIPKVKAIAEENEINFYYIDENTVSISLNDYKYYRLKDNNCFADAKGQTTTIEVYLQRIIFQKIYFEPQRSCNTMFSINTIRKPL